LPRIDGEEPSPAEAAALNDFLARGFEGNFEAAVLSFAAEVCLLEVRHRSRPEVIDRPTTAAFLCYFFRVLSWLARRLMREILTGDDPTIYLITQLLGSPSPKSAVQTLVRSIGQGCKDRHQRYEFLRRAALVDHFSLERRFATSPNSDWDPLLTYAALCDRYGVSDDSQLQLPGFELLRLPVSYLGLSMPPYSFAILNTKSDLAVCLLSGKVVGLTRNSGGSPWIGDHLATTCKRGASLFLGLTGQKATSIFVASPAHNCAIPLRGIYVDACGDEDPGLAMGRIVNLSTDRLSQVQEMFVSGAWTDHLGDAIPLDRFIVAEAEADS
jgi:hypothetical protein